MFNKDNLLRLIVLGFISLATGVGVGYVLSISY